MALTVIIIIFLDFVFFLTYPWVVENGGVRCVRSDFLTFITIYCSLSTAYFSPDDYIS